MLRTQFVPKYFVRGKIGVKLAEKTKKKPPFWVVFYYGGDGEILSYGGKWGILGAKIGLNA